MTVHLHDLIEEMETGHLLLDEAIDLTSANSLLPLTEAKAREAVCFDMGGLGSIEGLTWESTLIQLPYPVCWFEGLVDEPEIKLRVGALCWTEDARGDNYLCSLVFFRHAAQPWALRGLLLRSKNEQYLRCEHEPGGDTPLARVNTEAVDWVMCFLTALNCMNVSRTEHRPSEKLQAARKRRGKLPLVSYWTLELDVSSGSSAGEIGDRSTSSHASPRLHLRRGHARRYAEGKWCWVRAHIVGDKSAGLVQKDYAARYENERLAKVLSPKSPIERDQDTPK